MKKVLFAASVSIAMLFSCNGNKSGSIPDSTNVSSDTASAINNPTDNTGTKMATDTGKQVMNNGKPGNDVTEFVQKAASGGMMEVEMGKYAAAHAQSQRVKDFGNMMATDHTAADDELKNMATSNNIQIPNALKSDDQMHMDMMKKKSGAAFDKAYMDMMVNDHKKDIEDFKKAASGLSDPSYTAFAAKTLPVLQKHLDSAQAIHKTM